MQHKDNYCSLEVMTGQKDVFTTILVYLQIWHIEQIDIFVYSVQGRYEYSARRRRMICFSTLHA
jgi:hypothetical protein